MIIDFLETTVNIDMDLFRILDIAAGETGKSKSCIIKLALKNFDLYNQEKAKFFCTVKYQKKVDDSEWKKFHLTLSPVEYEIFTDFRNFCKLSLSLIISLALKKYLQGIIDCDDTLIYTDTYLFPAYCCIVDVESDIKNYTIYWGVPEELSDRGRCDNKLV